MLVNVGDNVLSYRSNAVCERCVRDDLSSSPAEALDVFVVARTPTQFFVQ